MNKGGNRIKVLESCSFFVQYAYAFIAFLLFEFLLAKYRNLVTRRMPFSQRFTKYSTHGEAISSESSGSGNPRSTDKLNWRSRSPFNFFSSKNRHLFAVTTKLQTVSLK